MVALRTAQQAARGGITCSIDPTPEGVRAVAGYVKTLHTIGDPQTRGPTSSKRWAGSRSPSASVPTTSHFAHVLVAADYRMKRLAMGFDPPPIRGLPSFLHMIERRRQGHEQHVPRWWLEPKYESLLRDAEGLAWELRGGSVKAMTEEDFFTALGDREHTGKASPLAKKWADNMTAKYDELALAEPIFGQLQNCMDMAVVGALIVKENLPAKAGDSLPVLMDSKAVKAEQYPLPKQVDSKTSVLKKGRNWLISASGGVSIQSWAIVGQAQKSDAPAAVHAKAAPATDAKWCWN